MLTGLNGALSSRLAVHHPLDFIISTNQSSARTVKGLFTELQQSFVQVNLLVNWENFIYLFFIYFIAILIEILCPRTKLWEGNVSVISVCMSFCSWGVPTWPLPMMYWTSNYRPLSKHQTWDPLTPRYPACEVT